MLYYVVTLQMMHELTAGEKLCLTLRSSAINCTIEFDTDNVRMEETYLGLSRSKILTIHNRSDYVVKFQWMRYEDKEADMQRKEKYDNVIPSRIFPINLFQRDITKATSPLFVTDTKNYFSWCTKRS